MNYFCQCCGYAGMEHTAYEICTRCNWENDNSLEDESGNLVDVTDHLSDEQRNMWSCANSSTPNEWLKKAINPAKI